MCRGLFEKDKLLFSFLVTCKIMQAEKHSLDPREIRFLATGGTLLQVQEPNPTLMEIGDYFLTDKQ